MTKKGNPMDVLLFRIILNHNQTMISTVRIAR